MVRIGYFKKVGFGIFRAAHGKIFIFMLPGTLVGPVNALPIISQESGYAVGLMKRSQEVGSLVRNLILLLGTSSLRTEGMPAGSFRLQTYPRQTYTVL
jgi:hypothetical protein